MSDDPATLADDELNDKIEAVMIRRICSASPIFSRSRNCAFLTGHRRRRPKPMSSRHRSAATPRSCNSITRLSRRVRSMRLWLAALVIVVLPIAGREAGAANPSAILNVTIAPTAPDGTLLQAPANGTLVTAEGAWSFGATPRASGDYPIRSMAPTAMAALSRACR